MRVLLVDHDSEGLEAISRAIRGVLELDCVTSKGDALLLLRQNTYDVLVACERCVDGSGLDLLGRTTRTTVPLKRIFAAAQDRLQLLGPRLAPFKVQRTIAYPIDLEELWLAIAQVTGTNDETDGTIERVVLDERGIPASGTTPRAPIPSRPPAPLREVRPATPVAAPPPAPAIAASLANGGALRTATARMAQPAPEPPLRAPPPPRQPPMVARQVPPASTSDTGRMRGPVTASDTGRMRAPVAPSDTGRMRALAPPPAPPPALPLVQDFPAWVPETPSNVDDFAQVSAQARLGVERKVVDEAGRRKKRRLITASISAVAVAAVIVVLIEKFYDPEARARESAIAAEVTRMAEQQKVTESLLMIENDIEQAIMDNKLDLARSELARLVEQSPAHPRREFLQASIDRAAELTRLAAKSDAPRSSGSAEVERSAPRAASSARPARQERQPERIDRDSSRTPTSQRTARADTPPATPSRVFGAPIGDQPVPASIPLDAPINSPPTTTPARRADNSFSGRTVEAGDPAVGASSSTAAAVPGQNTSGSATVPMPAASTPAPTPPAPVDVVPAKLVKRVTPIVSADVPRKTQGFVVVRISINDAGRVSGVEVVESSPTGVFDNAALSAVRKWVYEPRRENGVAVASQSRARLVFEGE